MKYRIYRNLTHDISIWHIETPSWIHLWIPLQHICVDLKSKCWQIQIIGNWKSMQLAKSSSIRLDDNGNGNKGGNCGKVRCDKGSTGSIPPDLSHTAAGSCQTNACIETSSRFLNLQPCPSAEKTCAGIKIDVCPTFCIVKRRAPKVFGCRVHNTTQHTLRTVPSAHCHLKHSLCQAFSVVANSSLF